MNNAYLIKKQLDIVGNQIYLVDDDWTSMPFNAVINHLWRKKSSAFESEPTEIGLEDAEYYLYIGPFNHDITSLSNNAVVLFDDEKFEFKRRDTVKEGGEVIYYTGVLRKLKEENYDEY